jgi:hypothetical protein
MTPNTVANVQQRLAQIQAPLEFNPAPHRPERRRVPVNTVAGPSNAGNNAVAGPSNAAAQPQHEQPRATPGTIQAMQRRIEELNVPRQFQPVEQPRRGRRQNIPAAVPRNLEPEQIDNRGPPRMPSPPPQQPQVDQPNNPAGQPNAPELPFPNFVPLAALPKYFKPLTEADVTPINLGPMNLVCSKCHAKHWEAEKLSNSRNGDPRFGTCCLDGKIVLPAVKVPPRPLLELFDGTSNHSAEFKKNIRRYNAAFALASLGVTVDKSVQDGHGPYVFKIQGGLYHNVGSLLPEVGKDPVYAQLYFYSSEEANAARLRRNRGGHNNMAGLNAQVMGIIDQVLRENHAYVHIFKTAYERLRDQQAEHPEVPSEAFAVIQCEPGTDARRYNAPTANEVAVVLPGDGSVATDHRDLILHYRNGPNAMKRIYETNASYQPILYVLLFPYGENGWHTNMLLNLPDEPEVDEEQEDRDVGEDEPNRSKRRSTVSILEYFAYRLHQRQTDSLHIFRAGNLFQQWIVDAWAATDQGRLNWLRNNQAKLRVDLYKGLADAIANDAQTTLGDLGQRFILPSSYIGGSRFMFQLYQDSLAIARFSGKPDWFLTMTADGNWPEIKAELLQGQTAADRPDLVARVYREKVRILLKAIKNGAFGKYAGVVYTIEFQKRGLPHIHILIFLSPEARLKNAEDIDRVVSAQLPDPEQFPQLFQLVTKLMVHNPCGTENPNAPCMRDGKCSKGYPKPFQTQTQLSQDGYTLYARPDNQRYFLNSKGQKIDNRWIVPHSPR